MRGGAGYQPERILGVTKNVRSPSSGTLRKLQAHDPQGKFARDLVASAAIRHPPPHPPRYLLLSPGRGGASSPPLDEIPERHVEPTRRGSFYDSIY